MKIKKKYYLSIKYPQFKENYSLLLDFLLLCIKYSDNVNYDSKEYINFIDKLVKSIKPFIYYDIDCKCDEYYKDLTIYLNKREKTLKKRYIYVFPLNNNKVYYESKNKKIKLDKNKITVLEKKGDYYIKKFKLSSDTFGFTGNPIKIANKMFSSIHDSTYPISKLLNEYAYSNNIKHSFDEAKNIISNFIYKSRTIGGSFIWPSYERNYNFSRGINKYIEDRVDLTLFEIKNYYNPTASFSILGTKNNTNFSLESKWLNHIGNSFEEFIDYFELNDFVIKKKDNKYYPKNIITNKELDEKEVEKYIKEINKNLNADDILNLYTNLLKMIEKRNNKIYK